VTEGLQARVRRRLGAFRLDVDVEAPPAAVTAVFGPSGAGKSQLLAAIAGAGRPDEGRVVLDGRMLFDSARRIDTPMERRGVGWVSQDGRLFPHLTVEANLRYGARRARGRQAGVRFDDVVDVLGVAHLLQRRPDGLSGGERQRVAIGRALLSQPALLLMDEPLAALDLPRRAEILPYLERLRELSPAPILYVTHALSEVVRLADRLLILQAGRVLAQGPLAEVLARTDLTLITGRPDTVTALELVVTGAEEAGGLTRLMAGGAVLLAPRLSRARPGQTVRAAVLARDVLIATAWPHGLSARNVLPATVESLASPRSDGVVLVGVRLKDGPLLLSAVTTDAVGDLRLCPGADVFAILKSVAIEGLPGGGLLQTIEMTAAEPLT
jgi:molybdate transport system ATP-binding protein